MREGTNTSGGPFAITEHVFCRSNLFERLKKWAQFKARLDSNLHRILNELAQNIEEVRSLQGKILNWNVSSTSICIVTCSVGFVGYLADQIFDDCAHRLRQLLKASSKLINWCKIDHSQYLPDWRTAPVTWPASDGAYGEQELQTAAYDCPSLSWKMLTNTANFRM